MFSPRVFSFTFLSLFQFVQPCFQLSLQCFTIGCRFVHFTYTPNAFLRSSQIYTNPHSTFFFSSLQAGGSGVTAMELRQRKDASGNILKRGASSCHDEALSIVAHVPKQKRTSNSRRSRSVASLQPEETGDNVEQQPETVAPSTVCVDPSPRCSVVPPPNVDNAVPASSRPDSNPEVVVDLRGNEDTGATSDSDVIEVRGRVRAG